MRMQGFLGEEMFWLCISPEALTLHTHHNNPRWYWGPGKSLFKITTARQPRHFDKVTLSCQWEQRVVFASFENDFRSNYLRIFFFLNEIQLVADESSVACPFWWRSTPPVASSVWLKENLRQRRQFAQNLPCCLFAFDCEVSCGQGCVLTLGWEETSQR